MNTIGLLWYDGDPTRPLEEKVRLAVARYQEKHGAWPSACQVHRGTVPVSVAVGSKMVAVEPKPYVLLHHFYLIE